MTFSASDFTMEQNIASLERPLPSVVDGLKPAQRKVLFCSFKRNLVKETKVSHLAGYVAEHSAYQDGVQSVANTIIGMAQDFVGTNNISLLEACGLFGTRYSGGKDAAKSRHIYTRLAPITRLIFPKDDDVLLNYLNEDGMSVEPSWYMPIIPMVLVNGCEGIDPGSKNYIPSYNPRDVIANLKRLLNGETVIPMDPWYKGFKGSVKNARSKAAGVTYTITGVIKEVDNTKLKITELPVRYWTVDYKNFLESVCPPNENEKGNEKNKGKSMVKVKEPPFIEEYRSRCDHASVEFEVILSEQNMNIAKKKGLEKKFKLTATIKTTNVNLFDSDGKIRTYGTPEDILKEFFQLRLEFYTRRKAIMLQNIGNEILKLKNKVRFILAVISEDIVVNNRKTAELFLELKQKGYEPLAENYFTSEPIPVGGTEVDEENEEIPVEAAAGVSASDYEYLLTVAICTLTVEKAQELIAQMNKLEAEAEILGKATPEILWLGELDALEKELDVLDGNFGDLEEGTTRWPGGNSKGEKAYNPNSSSEHSGNPAAEKPKTTIRKRAPARSKDVFKPTSDSNSSAPSPEKKVRKMRASPFNKKSGSRLRITSSSTGTEDAEAPPSDSLAQPITPRRTARETKAKAIYIDSGSDDNV